MARTLLAPHWNPVHRDATDAAWFREWRPPLVKVLTDDERVPYLEDLPAGAGLIVRNYPLSEMFGQRGFIQPTRAFVEREVARPAEEILEQYFGGQGSGRDLVHIEQVYKPALRRLAVATELPTPEQVGEQHAEIAGRMADYLRSKGVDLANVWHEGLNEPMFWSIEPPEHVARYERARLIGLERRKLNGMVLNAGVGWPGNGGVKDAPVDWTWFNPVMAVWRKGTRLGLHEYWFLDGPWRNWRWWGGRYEQCTLPVPIVMTESGIDCGVVPGEAGSGWLRLPEPNLRDRARHYIADLAWYEAKCIEDGRVEAICIFTHDGVTQHWTGFNIKQNDWQQEFRTWLAGRPELQRQEMTYTPTAPVVISPAPVTDPLLTAFKSAFGDKLVDLRDKLPVHPTLTWPTRETKKAITHLVVHHTAVVRGTKATTAATWEGVARYHISKRTQGGEEIEPWPGIGYHAGIGEDGTVYLLNGINMSTYHAGKANPYSIGVVFNGYFTTETPTPAAMAALATYRAVVEKYLGKPLKQVGHRDVGQTACPGNKLYAALYVVAPAPSPTPPEPDAALVMALLKAGAAVDLAGVNPPAALHRAIVAGGFVPTSGEFPYSQNNRRYVAQCAHKPGGKLAVFFCEYGKWDQVQMVQAV